MTPYMCLENCMKQELHQRYDKTLFFGITQRELCLCGYDYEEKKTAGTVHVLDDTMCEYYCCGGSCPDEGGVHKCGGEFGRVSLYQYVRAPVTIGLQMMIATATNPVSRKYSAGYVPPPEVTPPPPATPAPSTPPTTAEGETPAPTEAPTTTTTTTSTSTTTTTTTTTSTTPFPTTVPNFTPTTIYNSNTQLIPDLTAGELASTPYHKLTVMEVHI